MEIAFNNAYSHNKHVTVSTDVGADVIYLYHGLCGSNKLL